MRSVKRKKGVKKKCGQWYYFHVNLGMKKRIFNIFDLFYSSQKTIEKLKYRMSIKFFVKNCKPQSFFFKTPYLRQKVFLIIFKNCIFLS